MKKKIYLILHNIRSRENVGSIFRTADAAGVEKIYLCGITPTPSVGNPKFEILNPKQTQNLKLKIQNSDKIHKTALGAEMYVPWESYRQTWRCLSDIKNQSTSWRTKIKIIGLEKTRNSKNIFSYKLSKSKKIVLVLGNEVKGLSLNILKYCDEVLHIPMYGKKESLNVAVAAGIALYIIKHK